MKWITDEDLKTWSRRTAARELFIDLVGDLIRATIGDAKKFRFPGQDSGTLRGFDGALQTTEAISRVPAGKSLWEFGTGSAGKRKAQDDYDKRTQTTSLEVMAENAFVMLNLNSWDTPSYSLESWLAERNAEGKWREVHYIDGTTLASWLEEMPAVAAKYARNFLNKAPRTGALSTDEFWMRYSSNFKPTLKEEVLLCGREDEANQLLQALTGGPQNFPLAAESDEEVFAFAVAVIRTAPEELRRMLELRTMIVETAEAAQHFLGIRDMIFFVRKDAKELAGSLGLIGPTLTAVTGVEQKRKTFPTLKRPTASAMAEAMESMGIERQEGYNLAHKCGRSLTILRRQCSVAGFSAPAEWEHLASSLKPAFLAGGWTTDSSLDKEVVASLAGGTDYIEVESRIRPTLLMSDPPFDKVEQVWQIRAAVDAFPYYGHLIDDNDLQRLKAAVIRVLGHQVAPPSPEEKFSFTYQAPEDYSSWLREGLVQTLTLFAVMSDVGGLQLSGTTPQRYVEDVIRSLPDFTMNHAWILRILPQLPAVAEAAPTPFLEALEKSLEGHAGDALNLFQDSESYNFLSTNTSPHIYVLWALEVLAWDPILLPRVTLILGQLAKIDPGKKSKNGNRPLGSLRKIFMTWSPNTDADLKKRFIAIDRLIERVPDVAWDLLLLLMPRSYDIGMPTVRPKLRDSTPIEPEIITFGLVWMTETYILERAIKLSKNNENRTTSLVKYLHQLQPDNRARLVNVFEEHLRHTSNHNECALWQKIRDFISHHESFPGADWSLKGGDLARLKELLEQYRPNDIVAQVRYYFDGGAAQWGGSINPSVEDIDKVRVKCINDVHFNLGIHGVIRLAKTVNAPLSMSEAFNNIYLRFDETTTLILSLIDSDGDLYNLACNISGSMRRRLGYEWAIHFTKSIVPHCESSKDVAWLIRRWPNNAETWTFAQSLGQDVVDYYWSEVGLLPWDEPDEDLLRAISELRRVGNSLKVLCSISRHLNSLNSKILLALLDESVADISSGKGDSNIISYAVDEIFTELKGRDDVTLFDVARREYSYLQLIERSTKDLSIHTLLAKSPSEYIGIINSAFVSKNEERDTNPSAEKRAIAAQSYRLLSSFHTIPGEMNNTIDEPTLFSWVNEVRKLANESGRDDIVDLYIGQLLAHSKPNLTSGSWPPAAVASVLEQIASDNIEDGIVTERFNMRGVYVKPDGEGGLQEREFALRYRQWAGQATSIRTAAMLEQIAERWEEDAKRADIKAEQRKLKR